MPREDTNQKGYRPAPLRPLVGGPRAGSGEDERGAVAVEFALLLSVLVLILFGIIEFSIGYNQSQALHAAAREGARTASLPQATAAAVTERVTDALSGINLDSPAEITITPDGARPCNLRTGQTVSVTVRAQHSLVIPFWGDQSLSLSGRGSFRCE